MNFGYGGMRKSEIPKNKDAKATKSKKVQLYEVSYHPVIVPFIVFVKVVPLL